MMGKNGLPEGWERIRLGDITEPSKEKVHPKDLPGVPYIGLEHIEKETGHLLGHGVSDDVRSTKAVFHPGDLLYGKLRPYLNKVYIPDFDGICSTDILVFPKIDRIDNRYLFYRFMSGDFVRYANRNVSGVQHPRVSLATLAEFEIELPPRPEQERIVAKIEETFTQLEAGVAELQNAKAQLKRYRAAVLKSAVEGELTREWREAHQSEIEPAETLVTRILEERRKKWEAEGGKGKNKEPAAPNTEGLPDLPEGWVWANHDQLILQLKNGFFGGRPETEPPGVPLLRISAVRPMSVSYDSLRYIRDITEDKLETYQIRWGDLLFTRYNGNPNLVGACGMVRNVSESTLYPDKLIRVVVPKELIKPEYLEIYFATNLARSFINPKIKSTAGQNGIAGGDLKDIPVIIPPFKEQQRIVEMVERRLSVADEIEKELDESLVRAERLRGSVLKSVFEGRL